MSLELQNLHREYLSWKNKYLQLKNFQYGGSEYTIYDEEELNADIIKLKEELSRQYSESLNKSSSEITEFINNHEINTFINSLDNNLNLKDGSIFTIPLINDQEEEEGQKLINIFCLALKNFIHGSLMIKTQDKQSLSDNTSKIIKFFIEEINKINSWDPKFTLNTINDTFLSTKQHEYEWLLQYNIVHKDDKYIYQKRSTKDRMGAINGVELHGMIQ